MVKRKRHIRWKHIVPFYAMLLPGFLYLVFNNYLPMFGILLAFKKINFQKGILKSDWCGLQNFRFLFLTNDAWIIMRNTILYNIIFFIVGTGMAVMLAVFFNEIRNSNLKKIYQTFVLLPYLLSWVVVGYLGYAFFSTEVGFINSAVLGPLGLEPVSWYQEKKYWPFILTFFSVWKNVGYNMIIYYSSIVGIDQEYYEASKLDGASWWQQVFKITVPLLKPTILIMMILSLGQIFRSDFGLFYQIPRNSGPLYSVTRTIDVYVYQALMKNGDFGMSSAASVYQSVVCFVTITIANQIIKKHYAEGALF